MDIPNKTPRAGLSDRWSTRLLLLALLAILFLTLFPFRFTLHPRILENRSPFLLGGFGKDSGVLNALLNILLFVPFGFALAGKLHEQKRSGPRVILACLATGALLSYGVEFCQLYTVGRDSGWEDVITNGTGALCGSVLFGLLGSSTLALLSQTEEVFQQALEWPRSAALISLYFALWFAISVPMQMQTRLSNWHPGDFLVVGNTAGGNPNRSWKGDVYRLQVWGRPLPRELAERLTSDALSADSRAGLLADYDFSHSPTGEDVKSPKLTWTPGSSDEADPSYLVLDGKAWLASGLAVPNVVNAIRKTNQFAVRIVCKPAEGFGANSAIVSLSMRQPYLVDFAVWQENNYLVIILRNRLSGSHDVFYWMIRDVMSAGRLRDILLSYDGAAATVYLDGFLARSFRLSPGVVLGRVIHDTRAGAMNLYTCAYYLLVFFPGGILIGLASRSIDRRRTISLLFTALSIAAFALLLEFVLVRVSGRPPSWIYAGLSAGIAIAGALWVNAGGQRIAQPE